MCVAEVRLCALFTTPASCFTVLVASMFTAYQVYFADVLPYICGTLVACDRRFSLVDAWAWGGRSRHVSLDDSVLSQYFTDGLLFWRPNTLR